MSDQTIAPCLWLDDQAEAAAQFYTRVIPGSRVTGTSRYPERGDNPSGKPPGSILTVDFELAGQHFTALNGGPLFTINPTVSFFIECGDAAETRRIFTVLAEEGEALMPLDRYPWSPLYGWVADQYGVSWQVMTGRSPSAAATIFPCLMFAGPQHGQAEAAMQAYTRIFPNSRVDAVARYEPGEGPEGTVKHGRFTLAGQPLVAMDSHVAHDVTFNEGVSFQVMCKDQAEIESVLERPVRRGPAERLRVAQGPLRALLAGRAGRDRQLDDQHGHGSPRSGLCRGDEDEEAGHRGYPGGLRRALIRILEAGARSERRWRERKLIG
jgi:predicted 3-demethylubiquinone-9 3-methyltransferase (glyoxalase superfamily)